MKRAHYCWSVDLCLHCILLCYVMSGASLLGSVYFQNSVSNKCGPNSIGRGKVKVNMNAFFVQVSKIVGSNFEMGVRILWFQYPTASLWCSNALFVCRILLCDSFISMSDRFPLMSEIVMVMSERLMLMFDDVISISNSLFRCQKTVSWRLEILVWCLSPGCWCPKVGLLCLKPYSDSRTSYCHA